MSWHFNFTTSKVYAPACFSYECTTLDSLSHLGHPGKSACALSVSVIVSPQWTPGPQRAFLPQTIIQNVILVTSLALKSIEIHGGLHGRVLLKAASCPAAAVPQWMCGPPLQRSQKQNVSKRKTTSCDSCGGPASAEHSLKYLLYLISCSLLYQPPPFFNLPFKLLPFKTFKLFFYFTPSNSPFPFMQS